MAVVWRSWWNNRFSASSVHKPWKKVSVSLAETMVNVFYKHVCYIPDRNPLVDFLHKSQQRDDEGKATIHNIVKAVRAWVSTSFSTHRNL